MRNCEAKSDTVGTKFPNTNTDTELWIPREWNGENVGNEGGATYNDGVEG